MHTPSSPTTRSTSSSSRHRTTPNDTHVPLALAALEASKHVAVEKPVGLDAADAQRLADAARTAAERGLVTTVFHNRRLDGDFLTLADALERELIGRPVSLESRFDRFRPDVPDRWRDREGPGSGVWIDLGPHLVDQAVQLFGLPAWVMGDLRILRDGAAVDDDFHVVLGYDRMRVVLAGSTLAARPGPRFDLRGTTGALVIEGLDPQEANLKAGRLPGDDGYGLGAPDATLVRADDEDVVPRLRGAYDEFYPRLRDAIRGLDDPPVSVDEAVVVMRIIDAAVESSRTGTRVCV